MKSMGENEKTETAFVCFRARALCDRAFMHRFQFVLDICVQFWHNSLSSLSMKNHIAVAFQFCFHPFY